MLNGEPSMPCLQSHPLLKPAESQIPLDWVYLHLYRILESLHVYTPTQKLGVSKNYVFFFFFKEINTFIQKIIFLIKTVFFSFSFFTFYT